MIQNKFDIHVYAHWKGMSKPKLIGLLSAHFAKGRKAFSFEYDRMWLQSEPQLLLDPDIQFFSAMTMTSNNEDTIRDNPASYLDIAEFIQTYGANINSNLHQLWRRIVFNIAISNTDDHLRNHGFILTNERWILSPAYDLNPSTDKDGLSLNIDMYNNALDIDLARSVGDYFRLTISQMDKIISEVKQSVNQWQEVATKIGISRSEQEWMKSAFLF